MLWIKSYLSEVGRHLPESQRDDILAELEASLSEQAQDLAGSKTPTAEQQQQVIDRMGHPLKVAAGFDRPRYLIGPELFPTFLEVLKIVLLIVATISIAVQLAAYVGAGLTTSFGSMLKGLFDSLLRASAIVAVVFITSEYFGERLNFYDEWRASSLKPYRGGSAISRGDLITNLVSEGCFLLWWNAALNLQNWIPGAEGVLSITLSEAWAALYWPLNLLCGAWFVLHAVVFLRGIWRPAALWTEVGLGLAFLGAAGWLLLQAPLVDVTGALSENATDGVNRAVFTTIVVICGFVMWDIWLAVKRLREGRYDDGNIALAN